MRENVLKLIAEVYGLDTSALRPDLRLADLGDSLDALDLAYRLETQLGLGRPLPERLFAGTVGEVIERVEAAKKEGLTA